MQWTARDRELLGLVRHLAGLSRGVAVADAVLPLEVVAGKVRGGADADTNGSKLVFFVGDGADEWEASMLGLTGGVDELEVSMLGFLAGGADEWKVSMWGFLAGGADEWEASMLGFLAGGGDEEPDSPPSPRSFIVKEKKGSQQHGLYRG